MNKKQKECVSGEGSVTKGRKMILIFWHGNRNIWCRLEFPYCNIPSSAKEFKWKQTTWTWSKIEIGSINGVYRSIQHSKLFSLCMMFCVTANPLNWKLLTFSLHFFCLCVLGHFFTCINIEFWFCGNPKKLFPVCCCICLCVWLCLIRCLIIYLLRI